MPQSSSTILGHAGQAHRISLLARQITERAGNPLRVLDLGRSPRAEAHRTAGVDDQAAAQIRIGLELLDVEPIRSAIGSPIEPPQIVARDVFSILSELDA